MRNPRPPRLNLDIALPVETSETVQRLLESMPKAHAMSQAQSWWRKFEAKWQRNLNTFAPAIEQQQPVTLVIDIRVKGKRCVYLGVLVAEGPLKVRAHVHILTQNEFFEVAPMMAKQGVRFVVSPWSGT